MSTEVPPLDGTVGPWSYPRRVLSRPEKYERLAFTFCRLGTTGLIAWLVGPAVFVLVVAIAAQNPTMYVGRRRKHFVQPTPREIARA